MFDGKLERDQSWNCCSYDDFVATGCSLPRRQDFLDLMHQMGEALSLHPLMVKDLESRLSPSQVSPQWLQDVQEKVQ